MKDNEDAHGQQIFKFYNKERSFSVIEREDGYINVDENAASLYFSDYKNWARDEKKGIKYAKGRCLDIGCGAGRVALYLQKKGLYCLSIDNSPLAIKVCKLRGVKYAKIMPIEDVVRFEQNYFDTIILFGNNFGLFSNKNKAKHLLRVLYKITSPKATIIASNRDPYITKNPIHFRYHNLNRKRGRMPGQLRVRVRFIQFTTPWYDYLYVSKSEMKELLMGTGWHVKKFFNAENFEKNGQYTAVIKKNSNL